MSICVETIFAAPVDSLKVNAKVCANPLPLAGVTETAAGGPLKAWNDAVSAIGPFMVTDALAAVPVKDPDPVPLQPVNALPLFADAEIPTPCPALNQLLAGFTPPPDPADMVRKYCCVKLAV